MNKIWLIIKREYLTRVKKKSFLVMTFLGPILFAGLLAGAVFLTLTDQKEHEILIDDVDGVITDINAASGKIESRFADRFKNNDNARFFFANNDMGLEDFLSSPYTLMVKIPGEAVNSTPCELYFKSAPSIEIKERITREIETALEQSKVVDTLKLKYEDYKRIKVNISLVEIDAPKGEEDFTTQRAMIGFAFALVIYFFIFLYGVQVMRGVIEEKTNRIVEVIVSSVKPFQLMMGKVIGIGMVGLTQFLMWVVLSSIVSATILSAIPTDTITSGKTVPMGASVLNGTADLPQQIPNAPGNAMLEMFLDFPWGMMIVVFIFFFVGGYMLYASLFAAIGAAVDNETDSQQFMMPITIPLIFGFIVSEFLIANPESTAGQVFSLVPFTSPVVMMVKTAIGCPWWQLALSIVLLIATFILMVWIAAKIYRVGILMYGKKPTYRELWKWIRYKN